MDAKTKNFQTILLVILAVGLAFGLMIFSGLIKTPARQKSSTEVVAGSVTIWGPFVASDMFSFIDTFNKENPSTSISYVAKNPETFDEELLEAFARGETPDLVVLPHTLLYRYRDKMIALDETALPLRTFRDLYSQGAEIFRTPEGTMGIPFGVDPLVMYYNRDIMESNGIINPPQYWNDDFLTFIQSVTKVAPNGLEIISAGAPLGEVSNIAHAPYIFSALALGLGSQLVTFQDFSNETGTSQTPRAVFNELSSFSNAPASSALEFYTSFSNSQGNAYTWNKLLPEARDSFISLKSALYFGFASELLDIQRKNPNLNFDVAMLPQIKEISKSTTYGHFYAFAVPKPSKNISGAFAVAGAVGNGAYTTSFLNQLNLQSVRKDLLSGTYQDNYKKIFNTSAIVARAWFSPAPQKTNVIFEAMISDVTSGRANPSGAILQANQKINEAFQ